MIRKIAAIVTIALMTQGCGFLSRKQSRFYSLDRIPPGSGVVAASGAPIGVDVVELPPNYDRRDMLVRRENRRLEVRESEQWSSTLRPLVLHTLAFDLAARLPEGMVVLPGEPIPTGAKRGVDVVFEELIAGPENSVTLDCRWTLRTNGRGDVSAHERIVVPTTDLTGPSIAAGTSQALAQLADRIAARVAQ